jgi:hypothetical protein
MLLSWRYEKASGGVLYFSQRREMYSNPSKYPHERSFKFVRYGVIQAGHAFVRECETNDYLQSPFLS